MPRYEFSEGTLHKFWEIELSGALFTTTHGKVGMSGQSSLAEFTSDAEAKREYDRLIAEKIREGYVLVGPATYSNRPETRADDDEDD